ncbi:MAG: hypothetical protein NDI61_12685 [Bdellovibrionaceae bacterium]|nr:hypothetical protein [Pseudobdellovibrionaceae bacterium]
MYSMVLIRRRREWWNAVLLAALLSAMFLAALRAEATPPGASVHAWILPSFVVEGRDTMVTKVSGPSVVSFNFGWDGCGRSDAGVRYAGERFEI